jgi:hypothetical protein
MRESYSIVGDGGAALPFEPLVRSARLVEAEGELSLRAGTGCEVRVLPVRSGPYNCLVRVMCEGRVLYPNPTQTAGYAPCELEGGLPIRALDEAATESDGDPRLRLDLREGLVRVEELEGDALRYRATLRLAAER